MKPELIPRNSDETTGMGDRRQTVGSYATPLIRILAASERLHREAFRIIKVDNK